MKFHCVVFSTRFEKEDSNLTEVEVDEVLGLVGNVGTEVSAHDAMPGWVVLFVEFFLDEGGDVFFNVVLLKSHICTIDGILLHVLGHIGIFDNCFSFRLGHFIYLNLLFLFFKNRFLKDKKL